MYSVIVIINSMSNFSQILKVQEDKGNTKKQGSVISKRLINTALSNILFCRERKKTAVCL